MLLILPRQVQMPPLPGSPPSAPSSPPLRHSAYPGLLAFTTVHSPLPHYLGDQQNVAETQCVTSEVTTDVEASSLLPLGSLGGGAPLPCCEGTQATLWRGPCQQPVPMGLSHLGSGSPRPGQDWTDSFSLQPTLSHQTPPLPSTGHSRHLCDTSVTLICTWTPPVRT